MRKRKIILIALFLFTDAAIAATRDAQLTNTTRYNYNYMYPYMNNSMRTNLNPGVTPSQNSNLIDTVVTTKPLSTNERRVVPRSVKNVTNTAAPRAATSQTTTAPGTRRVVTRTNTSARTNARAAQITTQSNQPRNASYATQTTNTTRVSSSRCLADYTDCMNQYCLRQDSEYNRCYCSARLSQIDSEYQPAIDNLIKQILTIQSSNNWSDAEMNEYWMDTVGKYGEGNSWINLDNALDIDWAGLESRVRGQNAFATGHEYCIQHLRGCYYMSNNMRDAYRSEIARDCDTYEQSLQRLKNAAKSIVETYK